MNADAPSTKAAGHPVAFWFIFWGEFAERFSFYGMRVILPMYLSQVLHFADNDPTYYTFKMAVYFLPLLGGFLADRYIGKYWAIVGFSVPYVIGHFILGIENRMALLIALSLLALGSGVTKPNISTLMGMTYDQQRPGQEQLLSSAFRWFYFSINVGAFLSQMILPKIRDHYTAKYVAEGMEQSEALSAAYPIAFQLPAWLMIAALIVFALGKPFYAVETPGKVEATPEQSRQKWQAIRTLLGFFGCVVFFWLAYEHHDGLWVYFARDYVDLHVPWSKEPFAPDQIQAINALCVMIFIPLLTIIFNFVDRDQKIFTAANKILLGFFVTAIATGIMSVSGFMSQGKPASVPLIFLVSSYVLLTLGEVLVYATGLELSYTAAPKSMKGFVTACFLVTMTLGNFLNMFYVPLYGGSLKDPVEARGPLLPGPFFGLTTLIVLAAAVVFYFVGRQLSQRQPVAEVAA
jgi:dipeptide/tripeptide permease